jgi:RNA recognition motif-containing protein
MGDVEEVQNAVPLDNANRRRVYVGNLSYASSWQDLKDHMRQAGEVVYADVFLTDNGYSKGCGVVEYNSEAEAQKAISTLNDTTLEGTERPIFVREDRIESYDYSRGRGRGGSFRGMPPRGRGGYMVGRGGRGAFMMGRGRAGVPVMVPMRGGPYRGVPMRGVSYRGVGARGRGVPVPYRGGRGRGRFGSGPVVEGSRANRQIFVGNLPYTTSWQDLKDLFGEIGPILRTDILVGLDGRSKGMGTVCFETEESAQKAIEKMNEHELEGRTIHVSKDKFAK